MKRNPMALMVATIALLLVLGLLFTGCGRNRAQDGALSAQLEAATASTAEETSALDRRERKLEQREKRLALAESTLESRLRTIEARVAEVEAREAEFSERETAMTQEDPEEFFSPEIVESVSERRAVLVTLPAATELELEIRDRLSSETSLVGDRVLAVLTRDLLQDGRVAAAAGARVLGSVAEVVPERKIAGQSLLSVDFDQIETATGEMVEIRAFFDVKGTDRRKRDAATIGGSAAGGAVLGRVLSDDNKTKGTVLGAVIGAAVGTAVARRNATDPIIIEPGSIVSVRLESDVDVVAVAPGDEVLARN